MSSEVQSPRYLTVQEVAGMLSVPVSWVYGKVAAGAIPYWKVGRYVRFSPAELAAWLEKRRG